MAKGVAVFARVLIAYRSEVNIRCLSFGQRIRLMSHVQFFGAAPRPNGDKSPPPQIGAWLGCCSDLENREQAHSYKIWCVAANFALC